MLQLFSSVSKIHFRIAGLFPHLHKEAAKTGNRKESSPSRPLRLHKLPTTEPMSSLANEKQGVFDADQKYAESFATVGN
jgi:hypothetical protein